jgi:uncharacterized protein (DUF1697 family)
MPTHLAFLRGINVGGKNLIAMAELRALLESLDFANVKTLLQSGNIVFDGGRKTGAALEKFLEAESSKKFGRDVDYHVRTAAEWRSIIERNPFPSEAENDPGHLLVMVFKHAPAVKNVKALEAAIKGPEYLQFDGRNGYFVYPAGVGTSRLTAAVIDRILGLRGTARNWNTTLKLAALVEK